MGQNRSATAALAVVDPAVELGEIDRRLFGSFVEHLGRCVYGGIYEPGHPAADADGNRLDVAELVRELGTTVVRYPGGNFASNYDWEDGVGPVEDRPSRLDLAWRSVERNTFGLGEMARWLDLVGAEMMYTVNLGTRSIAEARNLIEYANFGSGTAFSDLRIRHGAKEPYGIKTWCLGNEMDGPWQVGHRSAGSYGELAAQAATVMKRVDPSIELAVSGSSQHKMPSFPAWDAEVLERTYGLVDYLSLHAYYWQYGDDLASYLSASADLDTYLDKAIAACTSSRPRHAEPSGSTSRSTSGTSRSPTTPGRTAGSSGRTPPSSSRTSTPPPTPLSSAACSTRSCGTASGSASPACRCSPTSAPRS